MKYYPMVWILWCNYLDEQGSDNRIMELFAHKIDTEAFMRKCKEEDDPVRLYWIQEKEVVQ